MSPSDAEIRELIRSILVRVLEPPPAPRAEASPNTASPAVPQANSPKLIDEVLVRGLVTGSTFTVPAGARITPLARDAAEARGITLLESGARLASTTRSTPVPQAAERDSRVPPQRRVAIGADHGGYRLKEELKPHLSSLGYEVIDCGTHSTDPVDYPDIAYAVARLVAEGACANGIVVDGAGIGSCMAANKVPGVRAALCYDHATAVNSREHNFANVLTLGAGLIGANLAKQIVTDWLATPYGAERHAKRVEKIMAIEKRYAKARQ
jgi:ribose 5-phosphate isomerase B